MMDGDKKMNFDKVHVDYLSDEQHANFRQTMLETTGYPGEFLFPPEVFKEWIDVEGCKYGHLKGVCKCHLRAFIMGQDEAAFKEHQF